MCECCVYGPCYVTTTHIGTWRQTLVCHSDKVLPVPTSLPVHVAATLMVNPATAYRMMTDFVELKQGMSVCLCVCVCSVCTHAYV